MKRGRREPGGARRKWCRNGACARAIATIDDVREDASRVVRFADDCDLVTLMDRCGELPLPPYVGAGGDARTARYQTIFAREPGSVAAPTASLHFTPRVFDAIRGTGVMIVPFVLDVGIGTFKPMDGDRIDDHTMHAERYDIPRSTATIVNEAKRVGRRIVVAGTTALRALEASARTDGFVCAGAAETDTFISGTSDSRRRMRSIASATNEPSAAPSATQKMVAISTLGCFAAPVTVDLKDGRVASLRIMHEARRHDDEAPGGDCRDALGIPMRMRRKGEARRHLEAYGVRTRFYWIAREDGDRRTGVIARSGGKGDCRCGNDDRCCRG